MPCSRALLWLLWIAPLAACGRDEESRSARAPEESLTRPAGTAPSSRAPLEIPQDAPRVVFLGDSITAGLHLDPEQAFPALVQRLLADQGLPFRRVDAGVSGDTSAGGLLRLDWVLGAQGGEPPAVLVVELGGNDGLRGQPLDEIEARLSAIVGRAQDAGARVLLLGMQLPPSLGADYVRGFAELYRRVAEERGCAWLPDFLAGVGGVPEHMLEDGLHPSAAGHAVLAARLASALRPLLEAAVAARR